MSSENASQKPADTQRNPSADAGKPPVSRRQVLHAAAGLGAAAIAGRSFAAAPAAPAVVAGPFSGVLGANEKVIMGIIGSGGMGRHHMGVFKKYGVEWAAVSDIYEPNLNEGLRLAGDKAKGYHEYEKLLERSDLDAVLIASPEHWHHDHLIDTVKAGKDAYSEKPMCWSIEQGANMVKEVRKTDRIVQIGMQRRSSPVIRDEVKPIFDSGELGEVFMVRAEWYWHLGVNRDTTLPGKLDWERFCGPAGKQEFQPIRFRHWRYFWPFSGGNETDQGTHLMDVVQWMMNADRPVSAVQLGAVYENTPTETPDTFCCTFEYPNFLATWTLSYTTNTWRNGWSICFQGTKKSLFLTEAGYRVFDQVNGWENGWPKAAKENLPGSVTSTEPHTTNFLECIKTRKQPNATVELGHQAVRPLHLANAALKNGGKKAILGADGVSIKFA